ncbi:MAG: hypothetical protein V8R51_07475 [Clostridia bacterium]
MFFTERTNVKMTINIMSEYIELTKKQITAYLRLVFEDNYSKNIMIYI